MVVVSEKIHFKVLFFNRFHLRIIKIRYRLRLTDQDERTNTTMHSNEINQKMLDKSKVLSGINSQHCDQSRQFSGLLADQIRSVKLVISFKFLSKMYFKFLLVFTAKLVIPIADCHQENILESVIQVTL